MPLAAWALFFGLMTGLFLLGLYFQRQERKRKEKP